MAIALSPQDRQTLQVHAEQTYPQECCGVLVGTITPGMKQVQQVFPTVNQWNAEVAQTLAEAAGMPPRDASPEDNFSIAPEDLLRIQKTARDQNLTVLGFYHSHPNGLAQPSAFDQALAWSDYSYLILAVQGGKVTAMTSWILNEHQQLVPEEIVFGSVSAF